MMHDKRMMASTAGPGPAAKALPAENALEALRDSVPAAEARRCTPPVLTYAAVLRGPPPPRACPPPPVPARSAPTTPRGVTLGRPRVSLPMSQLTLGRGAPPWNGGAWWTDAAEVVNDEDAGVQVLRVRYPRGSGPPSAKGPRGGAGFLAAPPGLPASDITLAYRVRFAPGFQWSYGGKLPGLLMRDAKGEDEDAKDEDAEAARGGRHSPRTASCRLMWQREGGLIAYVYPPSGVRQGREYERQAGVRTGGKVERFGDGLFKGERLRLRGGGRWNTLVVRVKLNGFDDVTGEPLADGVLTLSLNGRAATLDGIVWRRYRDVKITHVLFSTFFGGKWTSPVDTHADFGDFALVP